MQKRLRNRRSESREEKIKIILAQEFEKIRVDAILKHFIGAKRKYQEGDWEGSISKSGKFVEAVTKALMRFCGKTLPRTRHFRAGSFLRDLEREPVSIDDAVRIVIPKCCLFIYEIANNRGARHDADEVNPNEIDASTTDVTISWVLGELIRFSSKKKKVPREAQELVEALTGKTYPFFEEIDGRFYVNIEGLSAEKTALLILYGLYPRRASEDFLRELVERHGFSAKNAGMAFRRVKLLCDIDESGLKLRGLGRLRAEKILDDNRLRRLKWSEKSIL
jgi:HEPN domain-containing protein